MKIIHAADLHLGSSIDSTLKVISKDRKREVRNRFSSRVSYAKDNGISVILLSGDVFDSDHPLDKDKAFFYDEINQHPDITFYYLKGNHDADSEKTEIGNLKRFSSKEWISYPLEENIVLSGRERSNENAFSFYDRLNLKEENFNIVRLHGTKGDTSGKDKINLKKLRNKNIDYLALGHLHSYQEGKLDERGSYAYPGCIQGRGFDETGEKGFILLDIEKGKRTKTFVPLIGKTIEEVSVDISSLDSISSVIGKIHQEVTFDKDNIYRINLTGDIPLDADFSEEDIRSKLKYECYFINVKNKTGFKSDIDSIKANFGLKGEFVRCILEDESLTEEERNAILSLGRRALEGKELD